MSRSLQDWRQWTALGWLAVAIVLCAAPLVWTISYFRDTGAMFHVIRALPVLLGAAAIFYLWLRKKTFWHLEPLWLAIPVLVALLCEPRGSLAVAWTILAAYSLGRLLLARLDVTDRDAPLAIATGFGALVLIFTAIGKLGLLYTPVIVAALLITTTPILFYWRDAVRAPGLLWDSWRQDSGMSGLWPGLVVFFAIFFVACTALIALSPVNAYDVIAYHFPLSRHYLSTHVLRPDFSLPESFFPQGGEVLGTLEFAIGGRAAAQLLVVPEFILYLWLVVRVARACCLSREAALLGAAAAAFLPFLHWTGSVPKDDLAMAVFQIGCLYALLRSYESSKAGWLYLGAFLLGQAFGIKNVALFGAIPLLLLFGWTILHRPKPLRTALLFGGLFAASGMFWAAETYVRTGNPAYPRDSGAIVSSGASHDSGISGVVRRYVEIPWAVHFAGQKAFESATPNPLGFFLVLFLPLPLLYPLRPRNPQFKACVFFTLIYIAYWSTLLSTLRYAIVPITLVVVWAADGLWRAWSQAGSVLRAALVLSAYGSMIFSLLTVLVIETNVLQVKYLLGTIGAEEYLAKTIKTSVPLFRIAALDPNGAVFGVGNCSRDFAPQPLKFGCYTCPPEGCRTEDVNQSLAGRDFGFVVVKKDDSYALVERFLRDRFGARLIEKGDDFDIFRLYHSAP